MKEIKPLVLTDGELRKIKNLTFKIDTTPVWLGQFIYIRMLDNFVAQCEESRTLMTQLNLCHEHRQEKNHSGYSHHNCDYCQLMSIVNKNKPRGE